MAPRPPDEQGTAPSCVPARLGALGAAPEASSCPVSPQAEVKVLKERLEMERQAWEANYVKKEVGRGLLSLQGVNAELREGSGQRSASLSPSPGSLAARPGAGAEGGGEEGEGQGDRAGDPAPGGRHVLRQGGV